VSRARPQDPWPWPADNPLERRSRVGRAYRDKLAEEAPEACAQLDAVFSRLRQGWVLPKRTTVGMDDLLTVEQAADYFDVKPRTIDAWRARGLNVTQTPEGIRYRVGDIYDYHRDRRLRRAGPATPPPS
jgi:hypothetical protein